MNPSHLLRSVLAERLGQTAGRWPRALFGEAEAPTLRQAIAERVGRPHNAGPASGGDLFPETAPGPIQVFHGTIGDFAPEDIRPWSHFGTEKAARHRLESQVDPQFRDAENGPRMRVLPYEITGRRIDVGREFDTPGFDNTPTDIADLLLRSRHITPEEHAWAIEPRQVGSRFEGRDADGVVLERLSDLAARHDIGAIGYQNAIEDVGSRSYLVPDPRNVRPRVPGGAA